MKKEEECLKENENNKNKILDNKTIEIKIQDNKDNKENENDNDNDKETDDILTKLENISQTSDDKSFDSPIIFNRNKTFYNGFNTDNRHFYYESFIINNEKHNNILNKNYSQRNKTLKKEFKRKKLINIKSQSYFGIKKLSNFHKELRRISTDFNIPKKNRNRNNSINNIKIKINFNKLESISENIIDNKISNNNMDIINKKLEKISSLVKEIKFFDKKFKNKDIHKIIYNFISKNNENNVSNNFFEVLNEILDYITEIFNTIQNNNNNKNKNKVGNERIIMKLQNELFEKDKEIGDLINKMNLEKDKLEKNFKSSNTEIINLKKQNKELIYKLLNAQKHIAKLESVNETCEGKLNKLIIEKTSKTINSSTSIRSAFLSNTLSKIEPPSPDLSFFNQKNIHSNEQIKNNNQKINDKYYASKKLNLNLIDLLKEINNMICYYDSFLNKEFGANKNMQNLAKNLINYMDINGLIEDKKIKIFTNEFMRNMDIVFKKIEEYIKEENQNKNIEIKQIKHTLTNIRHSSTRTIKIKGLNSSKNKDRNNNLINNNINATNITKKIKSYKSTMNINIPTRKRTKTINNPNIKDSV